MKNLINAILKLAESNNNLAAAYQNIAFITKMQIKVSEEYNRILEQHLQKEDNR